MNSYMIYSLISFIMHVFADFDFSSSKHVMRRCFRGLRGSRKIAKEAQNNPTQAKHTDKNKYKTQRLGSGRSIRDSYHHRLPVVFTTAHAVGGTAVRPPLPPAASIPL